jgi:glycosyltransferase involved in cell wall biosynthesis
MVFCGMTLEWGIAIFAIAVSAIQLAYWLILFSKLAFYGKRQQVPASSPSCLADEKARGMLPGAMEESAVSVVLCVRNEEKNVLENLPHILNQKYRLFEVVVVNDNSTDETWFRLLDFKKKYSNLTVLNVPFATPPGKKAALSMGIRYARYDIILLTDADCVPASPYWIHRMQLAMEPGKEIVLGFSPYRREKGFLNVWICFEAVYTAVQYFSFALSGIPYMGVGRNLMYRKDLFFKCNGFESHLGLASGDDDLFVNRAAGSQNTAVVLHPDAFVFTRPKKSWTGYYYQKTRHFSTGSRYRKRDQVLLALLAFSQFSHYGVVFALMVVVPGGGPLAFVLFFVRMAVVVGLYNHILRLLGERRLWPWVPLLDMLLPLYYVLFAPNLFFGKRTTWRQ